MTRPPTQPPKAAAPRALIRRLRDIMAGRTSGRDRLKAIVDQIAGLMVAEVSSIYARTPDGALLLVATQGLNQSAVGATRMAPGEGLVGLIARHAALLNLPDARSHPAFSYRPETGEEIYSSFLGAPILRGGEVIGVVTVQNQARRTYSSDDEEALQTTAMVLAELLAQREIASGSDPRTPSDASTDASAAGEAAGQLHLPGSVVSEGLALGHVVLHQPRIVVRQLLTFDVDGEIERLRAALERLRLDLARLFSRGDIKRAGEHHDVFAAYQMFADDRGWARRLEQAARTGLTAEAAVERVRTNLRARLVATADPQARERFRDIDDLSDRLLRVLTGVDETAATKRDLPQDTVLIARGMGAAELLDYDRDRLRGLALEEAGHTSHVAIVARALGIAAVAGLSGVTDAVDQGDSIIVDAEGGAVYVRPRSDVVAAYADKARFRARRQAAYRDLRTLPALSRDNQRVSLMLNAGLRADLPHLEQSGADGIGLFRTELEFMISTSFIGKDRQREIYREVLSGADGRPVIFRTLDLGSDKALPYARDEQEDNPALGWRAIRRTLDRTGLFRTQLRALLRAAAGGELRLMLPMVSDVDEICQARALLDQELVHLARHGHAAPTDIQVGAMLEVPSLLWQLDELCTHADFISIGSNDLQQFFYAVDRGNPRVATRYDPLSCAMLRALRTVVEAGRRHGRPVSLCGEMAGQPLEALGLIGVGMRCLSMAPASVGPVKVLVRSLDVSALEVELLSALERGHCDIRGLLRSFASDHGVQIDGPSLTPRLEAQATSADNSETAALNDALNDAQNGALNTAQPVTQSGEPGSGAGWLIDADDAQGRRVAS